ncbi:hypothetical protein [Streptomyces sp. ME18-1-4]|uniref:hypothetical protein n=1 Tax=Streptomyces sp. ME18-1-4 TaxID=3028685 RepID=UPI0029A832FF|nr:hypothetical protein [Streptomyces sp. ME18-1-4]MDX3245302.1 hypothetical protein [Streptomyces sp. ME18-1-4]
MGMVPLGIALLRGVVPAEKLSGSIALVSASMGIGGAIGLPPAAIIPAARTTAADENAADPTDPAIAPEQAKV